jgi:glycosyltransferase involved in cell wall biosynthesis
VQVVIPARNEAEYVGALLEVLRQEPETRITVVDGESSDETGAIARAAGARVVREARVGKGYAAIAGLLACDPVTKIASCASEVNGAGRVVGRVSKPSLTDTRREDAG